MKEQKYSEFIKACKIGLILLGLCLFNICCESEYSRTVKTEMESGVVTTDLFLGLEFGDTRQDFYAKCWKLNSEEKISQGPGNNFARYVFKLDEEDELSKVEMLFYGIFDTQGIMRGMDLRFSFLTYAPWNETLHSDELLEALKQKYMKDYPGNSFIKINLDAGYGDAFVKVDGNRQILLYPVSQKDLVAKIEDLRYKKTLGYEIKNE